MPLLPGTRLGSYEIVAALGAGGMGEVYRARDRRLDRDVALKVLPDDVASHPAKLARFEREARAVARLSHPNIVTLFSVENEDGTPFLTMELVEGKPLDHLLVSGGVSLTRLLELSAQLVGALATAHEQGIVHRDVKPGNLMVTSDGRLKVLDFGLAKLLPEVHDPASTRTATSPLSTAGQVVGTVAYMSPEQLRGETVDARSDLFSVGVVLHELATGERPFQGSTAADVASSILRDPPIPSRRVPAELARLIDRCLEKNRDLRIQTAREIGAELELLRRAQTSGSSPVDPDLDPDVPSIAVLPFENRSHDPEDEFFADGITEDVIAQLCKVRTLKVISRRSVMAFKNQESRPQDVAARLGVNTVLEGGIRRIGDRVRIVAQLVDARSGASLWAETFDRQLTDIFALQAEVALRIAEALQTELTPSERGRIEHESTRDVEAYEHYLRGRHCLGRYTIEGLTQSLEHFERALRRDPRFALAHAGMAMALTDLTEQGALHRRDSGPRAVSAGARALALDPALGETHCALAYALSVCEFDFVSAEAGFLRALELSPGNADTHDLFGRMYAGLERYDEAIPLLRRAYELDPLTHRSDLANVYLRAGRNEEAERLVRDAVRLDPTYPRLRATLGWALLRQGRTAEGLAELERATVLAPGEDMWLAQLAQARAMSGQTDEARRTLATLLGPARSRPASPYHLAYVHTGLGEFERALDCLERAFEEGTGALSTVQGSFLLAPLRKHPRFEALVARGRVG